MEVLQDKEKPGQDRTRISHLFCGFGGSVVLVDPRGFIWFDGNVNEHNKRIRLFLANKKLYSEFLIFWSDEK